MEHQIGRGMCVVQRIKGRKMCAEAGVMSIAFVIHRTVFAVGVVYSKCKRVSESRAAIVPSQVLDQGHDPLRKHSNETGR